MSDFYGPEVVEQLEGGLGAVSVWGITQGQGDLVGASLGELPVAQAVSGVTTEGLSGQEAAAQAQDAVQSIADTLP